MYRDAREAVERRVPPPQRTSARTMAEMTKEQKLELIYGLIYYATFERPYIEEGFDIECLWLQMRNSLKADLLRDPRIRDDPYFIQASHRMEAHYMDGGGVARRVTLHNVDILFAPGLAAAREFDDVWRASIERLPERVRERFAGNAVQKNVREFLLGDDQNELEFLRERYRETRYFLETIADAPVEIRNAEGPLVKACVVVTDQYEFFQIQSALEFRREKVQAHYGTLVVITSSVNTGRIDDEEVPLATSIDVRAFVQVYSGLFNLGGYQVSKDYFPILTQNHVDKADVLLKLVPTFRRDHGRAADVVHSGLAQHLFACGATFELKLFDPASASSDFSQHLKANPHLKALIRECRENVRHMVDVVAGDFRAFNRLLHNARADVVALADIAHMKLIIVCRGPPLS